MQHLQKSCSSEGPAAGWTLPSALIKKKNRELVRFCGAVTELQLPPRTSIKAPAGEQLAQILMRLAGEMFPSFQTAAPAGAELCASAGNQEREGGKGKMSLGCCWGGQGQGWE